MYVKASVSSKSGYMMAALGSIIIISSIISIIRISIIISINCNMLSNIVIIVIIAMIKGIIIVNTSTSSRVLLKNLGCPALMMWDATPGKAVRL